MTMNARALMVQGTASFAGKSVLVTGLCRLLVRRGFRVAPFKAQNMSLNSGATPDGREIGRAQMVQAEAARLVPDADMNPVLLKPSGASRCQVVMRGQVWGDLPGPRSAGFAAEAWAAIRESYARLASAFEVVVIEGAGSPAEINCLDRDLSNMRVAHLADAPVLLVADMDRGGAFASLYGTWALLPAADRRRIRGFVFNKLRGEPQGLAPGLSRLERETGVPTLGFLPWLPDLSLDEEDGVALDARPPKADRPGRVRVVVIRFPTIANFTDFAPLEQDPAFAVGYATDSEALAAADVLILPGSKHTAADLVWMRDRRLDQAVRDRVAAGARLIGICGGFQMLGRRVADPDGMEGAIRETPGLGLLDVETRMGRTKTVWPVTADPLPGTPLTGLTGLAGYEIHLGISRVGPGSRPLLQVRRPDGSTVMDGAASPDGGVWGTSLHGLFEHAGLRARLAGAEIETRPADSALSREAQYDRLADALEIHLDVARVLTLVGIE
ncbi:MAG: cobyric acid synthase CobQ [candidate division NC10 bacterium RIFCSPLOWO2_12_FULL_66_18]|nr:MAG: cobyric acid synthase CobQ [candidate division NC10 bacterium RIFCSPLOWO2_12_FULL_66_18]